jgi:serine protease Do
MRYKVIAFCVLLILGPACSAYCGIFYSPQTGSLNTVFKKINPAVVLIVAAQRSKKDDSVKPTAMVSSGVVISKDGEIMTAAHSVDLADKIKVQFLSGEASNAEVVALSTEADVALLKLDSIPKNLKVARLGDSNKAQVGDEVLVIGAPYGIDHTLTVGHISGRRQSKTVCVQLTPFEFLQTDAAINQGNSGGPMIDVNGKVIGIVSRILSNSGGSVGLGFAVSINTAKELLLNKKSFWIGFNAYLLSGDLAKAFNLPQDAGLLIQHVAENSPGDLMGLKAGNIPVQIGNSSFLIGGDIVLMIQGFPVTYSIDEACAIQDVIGGFTPETVIELTILREGKVMTLSNKKQNPESGILNPEP